MAIDGVNNVNGKDNYTVSGGGQAQRQEETSQVDMSKARGNTSEEGFAASGLTITKKDVKEAQGELGIKTSAKTKERVANIRNKYAQKIMAYCGEGCPPELKAIALSYAQELPMASTGKEIQNFKAACEAKLDAFRGEAQRVGLGKYLVQMEKMNQSRFDLGEVAADLRQTETELTIVQTGQAVAGEVNAHTDAVGKDVKNKVASEGAKNRAETRRQGRLTRGAVHAEGTKTRQVVHNEAETTRGEVREASDRITRNTAGLLGNHSVGEHTVFYDEETNAKKNGFVIRYSNGSATTIEDGETITGTIRSETNRGIKTNAENTAAMLGIPYGNNQVPENFDNYQTQQHTDSTATRQDSTAVAKDSTNTKQIYTIKNSNAGAFRISDGQDYNPIPKGQTISDKIEELKKNQADANKTLQELKRKIQKK